MIHRAVNYYSDVLQAQKENFSSPSNIMSQDEEYKEKPSQKKFGLSLEMEPDLRNLSFPTLFQGSGSLYMIDRMTDE